MADTYEQVAAELHANTLTILKRLDNIWADVGISNEVRKQRARMFAKHVMKLYNDMLSEAEESKSNLIEYVESLLQELAVIRRELQIDMPCDEDFDNVPLYKVKLELKEKLNKYEGQRNARLSEIKKLLHNEKQLCKMLGKSIKGLQLSPLPSTEKICEFQSYLEDMSDVKFKREEVFLKSKSRIIEIMNELQIKPSLDFERKVVCCEDTAFLVTGENMKLLEEFHSSLEKQLEDTKVRIVELREYVLHLWERLEENPEVRSEFNREHTGNTVPTLLALKEEVKRCEEKKRANIKLYVEKMREELLEWWDKCYYSSQERETFLHFNSDCYTEDLLTLHEIQIDHIKVNYEKNKQIYELYNKRQQLWEKMTDLEQRANQPDRFKNRGGQLLSEERERKSVALELPKVENQLLDMVKQYETENGKDFLISGERIQDVLSHSWEERKENRRVKLSVKKTLREQSKMTPSRTLNNLHLTPSMCVSKRKLITSTQSSCKRSRMESFVESKLSTSKSTTKKKRLSTERKRRLEKLKSRSRLLTGNDTMGTNTTNYEGFEMALTNKSTCRSSLFPGKVLQEKNLQSNIQTPRKVPASPICMSRKFLHTPINTTLRTPSRLNLRPKSPLLTPRLAAAPSNLPIII